MTRSPTRAARVVAARLLGAAALALAPAGCRTDEPAPAANPALRPIVAPGGGLAADADRAALARFIGVWSFEGWATPSDGPRTEASGTAAATIEHQHFVRLELRATSGQLGGRAGRTSGTMIFASEPGVGLTLTALGDASPAVARLFGSVEGGGAVFSFTEAPTPAGVRRVSVTAAFQTDDRWIAEVRDLGAAGEPVVARYVFTRAG